MMAKALLQVCSLQKTEFILLSFSTKHIIHSGRTISEQQYFWNDKPYYSNDTPYFWNETPYFWNDTPYLNDKQLFY